MYFYDCHLSFRNVTVMKSSASCFMCLGDCSQFAPLLSVTILSHASVFAKRLERPQRCCRCDCSHRPAHDCRDASDVFVEGLRPTSLPGRPRGSHCGLFSISKLDSAGWLGVYIFFSELGQSRERGALVTGWHDRWREAAGGGVSSVNLEY